MGAASWKAVTAKGCELNSSFIYDRDPAGAAWRLAAARMRWELSTNLQGEWMRKHRDDRAFKRKPTLALIPPDQAPPVPTDAADMTEVQIEPPVEEVEERVEVRGEKEVEKDKDKDKVRARAERAKEREKREGQIRLNGESGEKEMEKGKGKGKGEDEGEGEDGVDGVDGGVDLLDESETQDRD